MYLGEQVIQVQSTLMRGGTSKGIIVRTINLPSQPKERDRVVLRLFGSPDQNQVDGLGGGTSLTSKLALIGPPSHPGAHIDYTFGQVSLEKEEIDYTPTCGNMATAVGLFAAEEGYVELTEPITCVNIYNTNINKMIVAEIPVANGHIQYDGDFAIDGVPGASSKIMLNFLDSGGTFTGKTLPTGNPVDIIALEDGRAFPVSVIDCANIVIFVAASSLGLVGNELKGEIDSNDSLLKTLEQIRVEVGFSLGVIKDKALATPATNAIPKIAVISPPSEYRTITNRLLNADSIDIVARYFSMGVLHRAFAVSGAIALATAAKIPGTLASRIAPSTVGELRIGHPSGTIFVDADVAKQGDQWLVSRAAVGRTARRLMDGYAYVKTESLKNIAPS